MSMFDQPRNREDIYLLAAAAGAVRIAGEFSGGNDEGGYEMITLYNAQGCSIQGVDTGWDSEIGKAMEPFLDQWGSFAGEFHVHGTVHVDVTARKVKIDYAESTEVWESHEVEL